MFLWRGLQKFLKLSASQQVVFFKTLSLYPLYRLRLQKSGVALLLQNNKEENISISSEQIQKAKEIAFAVNFACRIGAEKNRCLLASVILQQFLRKHHIASSLTLGVAPGSTNKKPILPHAWVECDGIVVNDKADIAKTYPPFKPVVTS